MYNCIICSIEFSEYSKYINHLRSHGYKSKIQLKELYDLKIKKIENGICTECGNPTKFINFISGYRDTCSQSCAIKKSFKNPDNYNYDRTCSEEKKKKISIANKGRILTETWIEKMRQSMILRGKEGNDKARKIKQQLEKQLKNQPIPQKIQLQIDSYKENNYSKLLNSIIEYNQCIFCNEKFRTGSGLQTHLLFKHHYSNFYFYVNFFFYKRFDGKNHCKYCNNEILGHTKIICNNQKCITAHRKDSWKNQSIEKQKDTIKKANDARAISEYRHNKETCNKIKLHHELNDPLRRDSAIERQSKIMSDKIKNGEFSPWSNFKQTHDHFSKCENYEKLFCRSGLEHDIFKIIEIKENIISYLYEPFSIKYNDINNCHKYTVIDMLIKPNIGLSFIGEIKPWEYLIKPEKAYDTFLLYKMKAIRDYTANNNQYSKSKLLVLYKKNLIFIDIEDYLKSYEKRIHLEYLRINYDITKGDK